MNFRILLFYDFAANIRNKIIISNIIVIFVFKMRTRSTVKVLIIQLTSKCLLIILLATCDINCYSHFPLNPDVCKTCLMRCPNPSFWAAKLTVLRCKTGRFAAADAVAEKYFLWCDIILHENFATLQHSDFTDVTH